MKRLFISMVILIFALAAPVLATQSECDYESLQKLLFSGKVLLENVKFEEDKIVVTLMPFVKEGDIEINDGAAIASVLALRQVKLSILYSIDLIRYDGDRLVSYKWPVKNVAVYTDIPGGEKGWMRWKKEGGETEESRDFEIVEKEDKIHIRVMRGRFELHVPKQNEKVMDLLKKKEVFSG